LNALTEMSNYLYERMRPGMREILYRVREEEVQKNIAEKLSRKASSISRSKKRGGIDFVLEADRAVHSLLGKHYPMKQKGGQLPAGSHESLINRKRLNAQS